MFKISCGDEIAMGEYKMPGEAMQRAIEYLENKYPPVFIYEAEEGEMWKKVGMFCVDITFKDIKE